MPEAPEPPGEDDRLAHGQRVLEAEGAVGFAAAEAVLVEGRHIVVEGGGGGQFSDLTALNLKKII